jgi:hypothetical protein
MSKVALKRSIADPNQQVRDTAQVDVDQYGALQGRVVRTCNFGVVSTIITGIGAQRLTTKSPCLIASWTRLTETA